MIRSPRMNKTITRNVRSAPHTWVTCLHTNTFSSLMSSKCKTLEVVLSVFTQVWVSAFRCAHTFACPFTTRTNTHALTHHLLSAPYPWWRTLSLCLFEGGGEGEQQWSGTGLFFGRGQTLARLEGGHHPIPTPTPKGGDSLGPLLNLHLLWELHFRYIVQSFLQIGEGVFRLSQHSWIRLFLVPSFEGDLDSWTMSNGDELLTHMVQHMDGAEGNTFYFHLQHCWAVWLIAHLFDFFIIIIIIVIMRYQISLIFSFGCLLLK